MIGQYVFRHRYTVEALNRYNVEKRLRRPTALTL